MPPLVAALYVHVLIRCLTAEDDVEGEDFGENQPQDEAALATGPRSLKAIVAAEIAADIPVQELGGLDVEVEQVVEAVVQVRRFVLLQLLLSLQVHGNYFTLIQFVHRQFSYILRLHAQVARGLRGSLV